MRVVACAGAGATRLETQPTPALGPGDLLLRTLVSGLCGTDLFKLRYDTAPPGTVLGHEVVGEVTAAGEAVTRFSIGDRVVVPHHVACGVCALCARGSSTLCAVFKDNLLAPGGFSDTIRVGARAVARAARQVPAGMADETAVFLEPAACVVRGIQRAGMPAPGTPRSATAPSAMVLGAGSMGLLHVLVLRALDPETRILVSDPVPERRALALDLGANRAVDPTADLAAAAREMSGDSDGSDGIGGRGGLGVDAVFDCVGGAAALQSGLRATRPGGSVVLFAHAAAGEGAGFTINELFQHERRVIGTYSGALAEQDLVWELLLSGRLDPRPLVSHRLPLAGFAEGVALVEGRRALKVLFVPEAA